MLARILREITARSFLRDLLKLGDELLQILCRKLVVEVNAAPFLDVVKRIQIKSAIYAKHGVTKHLHQATVGVPRETLVTRSLCKPQHRLIVEAYVKHRVHHARHRELSAGANRHQQRIFRISELASHLLLNSSQILRDCWRELLWNTTLLHVLTASIRSNREPRRNRESELGHLSKVCTLATKQVLHVLIAFGEAVDVLDHSWPLLSITSLLHSHTIAASARTLPPG